MAQQKINGRQANIKILKIIFDTGTGTRSTVTGAEYVSLTSATGDTTYTAPVDVDILLTMAMMCSNSTIATTNVGFAINGTLVYDSNGLYFDSPANKWSVQTTMHKISVNAGDTVTIGASWKASSGTSSLTDKSTDTQFASQIMGVVVPR